MQTTFSTTEAAATEAALDFVEAVEGKLDLEAGLA